MTVLFVGFFVVSGFCGLTYEVLWMRYAMASFGVTTPVVSFTLSVFMAGLGVGSICAGRLVQAQVSRSPAFFLRLYAATEFLIAISSITVPELLGMGRDLLQKGGQDFSSFGYHAWSGLAIAGSVMPWCMLMGATFPLALAAFRSQGAEATGFSRLYLANVIGASAGTLLPAFFLIEQLGFRGTLLVAAAANATVAGVALAAARLVSNSQVRVPTENPAATGSRNSGILLILFISGCVSMGSEVVWIRLYTPLLGTVVYAFAALLGFYLVGTYLGSQVYRRMIRRNPEMRARALWILLPAAALMPLAAVDPRFEASTEWSIAFSTAAGVLPFSLLTGFLTPMLIDRKSSGDPQRAAFAYAVNIAGCIAGPLIAGFVLLPLAGERDSLMILAFPWLIILAIDLMKNMSLNQTGWIHRGGMAVGLASFVFLYRVPLTFVEQFPGAVVKRDSTATVLAAGSERSKILMVNGTAMTILTPITKMMAHLPFALKETRAENALVVCFGMGTSFRSALSWDASTTAVELIPSVVGLFAYFHSDAVKIRELPNARIVVDDGRRFLERSTDRFDIIVIDPPPPVGAAASSLLYSREFCRILRDHVAPGGIVQQWFPGDEKAVLASVVRALRESFPYVRVFLSESGWGYHILASNEAIRDRTGSELVARLPAKALRDLTEWDGNQSPQARFDRVLQNEVPVSSIESEGVALGILSDDHPVNEYYFQRSNYNLGWCEFARYQKEVRSIVQSGIFHDGPGVARKSPGDLAGRGYSAIRLQDAAFLAGDDADVDFLKSSLRSIPHGVTQEDISFIQAELEQMPDECDYRCHFKSGVLFMFLALSEGKRLSDGVAVDSGAIERSVNAALDHLVAAGETGRSLAESVFRLRSAIDSNGNGQWEEAEIRRSFQEAM